MFGSLRCNCGAQLEAAMAAIAAEGRWVVHPLLVTLMPGAGDTMVTCMCPAPIGSMPPPIDMDELAIGIELDRCPNPLTGTVADGFDDAL